MSTLKGVNILVALDENYSPRLNVMLSTLTRFDPDRVFIIYLLHTSIGADMLVPAETILGNTGRLIPIQAHDLKLDHAPTIARYPKEIYYRIFAARYLPDTLGRLVCCLAFPQFQPPTRS